MEPKNPMEERICERDE